MKKRHRLQLPILLLLGALLLSAGLNFYLLMAADNMLPDSVVTADTRVTESELELRLAQTQLAQCQAEQLRKDSVLVSLLQQPLTSSVKL